MSSTDNNRKRLRLYARGVVQGVGFRPHVYALATRLGLTGHVFNEPGGVEIEVEGFDADVDAFAERLQASPPPLAHIEELTAEPRPVQNDGTFVVRESQQSGARTVLIPPDIATCDDCLRELRDPADRRHRYPFINCTNCGPRYTIIRDLPYDRDKTTMAAFPMCDACRAEYSDPANRRYHAEPTCCPVCGPLVWLEDTQGRAFDADDPIATAIELLECGEILAVKGLGGFHLACNAANQEAVQRLRKRKARDLKPFAVMVRDLDAAEAICDVPEAAVPALTGRERPIVLLDKKDGHGLADEVAPRSASFGVMLPYTPLHHLLLDGPFRALVMTSGNLSDEPIAYTNDDAESRLNSLADAFLLHDRAIHIRTDDSVVRVIDGAPRFLRRSRGYAPFPIRLPVDTDGREILAVGPELNNTVCVTRGPYAFLSHHVGDLNNLPAYEGFLLAVGHMQEVLRVEAKVIARDLHPNYLSTQFARETALPAVKVQHHHAHIASVMVEHSRTDTVIGVSFDGLGFGSDGGLWGGEYMTCDLGDFVRRGHLEPVPQPGGDAAAKHTPRMAYSYLRAALGDEADAYATRLMPDFAAGDMKTIRQMIARDVNCPATSSVGRLFDAAAAVLGICSHNSYHAQAPMELEAAAWQARDESGAYDVAIDTDDAGAWVVRTSRIVAAVANDFLAGTPAPVCAARFHNSIARFSLDICRRIRDNTRISTVALSGGVFANAFLVERLAPMLREAGFEVLLNAQAPAGDGGVSLGQAAVAAWRLTHVPGDSRADHRD